MLVNRGRAAKGANNIFGAITHPLLSGEAIERIEKSDLSKLFVTDTIDLSGKLKSEKIKILSAADLFAEAIRRTFNNESISSLFNVDKG